MTLRSSLSHDEVQSLLPEYAYALVTAAAPTATDPDPAVIDDHLAACTECQRDFNEFVDAAVTLYNGALALEPVPSLVKQAVHILVEFSETLLEYLRPRQVAAAFRDTDDPRGPLRYSYFYKLPDENAPEVTIEIYDDRSAAELAVVDVFIQMPWRSPVEQAGTNVMLQLPTTELKGTTDACGYVSFSTVPRAAITKMKVDIRA